MIQGSEEWHAARLGRVTASRVADVMAKTKTGYSASRTNYMMELLCQRLTGKREEGFTSAAMQRGTELESSARSVYEAENGVIVIECGLVQHSTIAMFAASPDGIIGSDGLLEIKCPNTSTHIDFIRTGKPKSEYQWQMLAQMACTGRQWCDFVSFDDRLPEPLQFSCVRFYRDDCRIKEMIAEIQKFLEELDSVEKEMQSRMVAA